MAKKMYVVYCEDYGTYWCGLNTWDTQLRKAQVFHSLKYANDVHERFKELRLKNVEIRMERVPENPTHADRIRAMTDEELAVYLCKMMPLCTSASCPGEHLCNGMDGQANGLKKWLQQPAEENA